MPMKFGITKEDLLRSKVFKPGLYILRIKNIKQGPGTNDPSSTTTTIEMVVEGGTEVESQGILGAPITYWISEKAPGLAISFLEAVTGKKVPEGGIEIDLDPCIGRSVKAYVKNDMYNGRPTNKIDGFVNQ